MGKSWDSFVPGPAVWRECFRVLKPGGHLIAFAGSRTYDLMAIAVRLGGFELRDQGFYLYGSGFPKSLDISKALDKAAGAEREVDGKAFGVGKHSNTSIEGGAFNSSYDKTKPATPAAQKWQGWGTALKPAHEPFVIARKPLEGTVANNVMKHGVGGLNIDGCRHGERFPANLLHDNSEAVADILGDKARYFYGTKANKRDRNEGLEDAKNTHPTVKPTDLMAYLCRLVTPPGGTVLDPFMGSGSTGKACAAEGFEFIGVEMDAEYLAIASARISFAYNQAGGAA
jgi:site-specific DNA-methyltransferase (adenine-specific)